MGFVSFIAYKTHFFTTADTILSHQLIATTLSNFRIISILMEHITLLRQIKAPSAFAGQ